MGTVTRMELRKISELHPYEHNAKLHPPEQIEALRRSFREFGMIVPVGIDGQDRVIYGHGRLLAAQAEGWDEVPTVTVEDLSEDQRKAFIHADNLLGETGYDKDTLRSEAQALQAAGFDVTLVGFEAAGIRLGDAEAADDALQADHYWATEGVDSEEYQEWLEQKQPKKTSDDCYTPANIFEAVKAWVLQHYDLGTPEVVRPFFPGGDYQQYEYQDGCVVIDNPPFSILSDICRWYQEHGVRFFLFAPGVSLFSIASGTCHYLPIGVGVVYENKAQIGTSFVTNLGEWRIEIAPDLYEVLDKINDDNLRTLTADLPNYDYPDCVAAPARMNKLAKYGQALRIREGDTSFIRTLDAQRELDKAIFGGGFLLSEKAAAEKAAAEKAAAEKAAAEKAAAHRWTLSERELEIVAQLGKRPADG
jgi:hypothetical protein